MSPHTPIACSLSADELAGRLAEMRSIGGRSLRSVDADGAMRFRADPETRTRLERVIAAEARCCSFLRFDMHDDGDELMLAIAAPDGAEPVAAELIDAFAGQAGAAR